MGCDLGTRWHSSEKLSTHRKRGVAPCSFDVKSLRYRVVLHVTVLSAGSFASTSVNLAERTFLSDGGVGSDCRGIYVCRVTQFRTLVDRSSAT
jgi:hypothetical protein